MKKRALSYFTLAVTTCLMLTGSPAQQTSADTISTIKTTAAPSITVNKIKFEVIKDAQLPTDIKTNIIKYKAKKGYLAFADNGSYYIFISSGEKPTGGYGIQVLSIEDNEGKTNILVKETAPAEDAIVTTALTYPYTVIKASGITDRFNIKNEAGESFKALEATPVKASAVKKSNVSFIGRIDTTSIEVKLNGKPTAIQLGKLVKAIDQLKLKKGARLAITWQTNIYNQNVLLSVRKIK